MDGTNFLRFFLLTGFSLCMVVLGTHEIHEMYAKGDLNKGKPSKLYSPQRYVDIFYGAGSVEKAAFGKQITRDSNIVDRKRLDAGDRRDMKRIIKKVFR